MAENRKFTVAVTGATGAQGAAIAAAFAREGHDVRKLSRGDVGRGLDGAQVVVMTVPQDYRPGARERFAEEVSQAADTAGVSRLVLNLAAAVFEDYGRPVSAVLRQIRSTVLSGRTPAVVLQPTVYLDNMLTPWSLPAITGEGVVGYPVSETAAVSWMSHADLGRFAVAAAERHGIEGRIFDIGGPEALRGAELADRLQPAVGRPLTYRQLPLDDFAAGLNAALGAPAGDDIVDLYRYVEQHPQALARDPSGWADLGVEPIAAADWAKQQQWLAPAAGNA